MTAEAPFAGARVVVTRAEAQAGPIVAALRSHGADPVCVPTIRFAPPAEPGPAEAALRALAGYRWVCFTSQNGVSYAQAALAELQQDPEALRSVRLAAVGPATKRALEAEGLEVVFVPSPHLTRELGLQLPDVAGSRVLLLRAEVASQELPATLRARGAHVDDVAVYRTVPNVKARNAAKALAADGADWILFTSPSTVAAFVDLVGPSVLRRARRDARVAAIGPVTAAAAEAHGFRVAVCAQTHTMSGLFDALVQEVEARA